MASTKAASNAPSDVISEADQQGAIRHLLDRSIEGILHDILLEVHQEEKIARMQTAVIEVRDRAAKIGKSDNEGNGQAEGQDQVETKAATFVPGGVQLKGNPMKTVKHLRCPNCRLRRLLYPRVGYNSRPVPDPTEQYCKNEPVIIVDKHDVHGQRKKGVKVKGQAKGKNKKKNDPASPASENSEPLTPSSSMPTESFEFKEIDYPAAKCPNRDSHLGDHWKSVNVFATHLNGSCYLKRDRAAGREANAKIGSTPKDSRANSPKPTAVNGVKRKAGDDETSGTTKKKQKTEETKKKGKSAVGAPSKLREASTNVEESANESPIKTEPNGDTIQVKPRDPSLEPAVKLKLSSGGAAGSTARKKPSKPSKKA